MESFLLSFASMLIALAIVIALAWVILRLMRNRMQGGGAAAREGPEEALRYVRGLQLGAKERVVIVEHRGERWMLGVSAGGINTIAHWPAGVTPSFDAALQRQQSGHA